MKRVNEIYQKVDEFVLHHGEVLRFSVEKAFPIDILHQVMSNIHDSAEPLTDALDWDNVTVIMGRLPKYVREDFIALLTRISLVEADEAIDLKITPHLKRYIVVAKALGKIGGDVPLPDIHELDSSATSTDTSIGDCSFDSSASDGEAPSMGLRR